MMVFSVDQQAVETVAATPRTHVFCFRRHCALRSRHQKLQRKSYASQAVLVGFRAA